MAADPEANATREGALPSYEHALDSGLEEILEQLQRNVGARRNPDAIELTRNYITGLRLDLGEAAPVAQATAAPAHAQATPARAAAAPVRAPAAAEPGPAVPELHISMRAPYISFSSEAEHDAWIMDLTNRLKERGYVGEVNIGSLIHQLNNEIRNQYNVSEANSHRFIGKVVISPREAADVILARRAAAQIAAARPAAPAARAAPAVPVRAPAEPASHSVSVSSDEEAPVPRAPAAAAPAARAAPARALTEKERKLEQLKKNLMDADAYGEHPKEVDGLIAALSAMPNADGLGDLYNDNQLLQAIVEDMGEDTASQLFEDLFNSEAAPARAAPAPAAPVRAPATAPAARPAAPAARAPAEPASHSVHSVSASSEDDAPDLTEEALIAALRNVFDDDARAVAHELMRHINAHFGDRGAALTTFLEENEELAGDDDIVAALAAALGLEMSK